MILLHIVHIFATLQGNSLPLTSYEVRLSRCKCETTEAGLRASIQLSEVYTTTVLHLEMYTTTTKYNTNDDNLNPCHMKVPLVSIFLQGV